MKPTTLLVGFDSAWTAHNSGAIVGIFRYEDGTLCELGSPQRANYKEAEDIISRWRAAKCPKSTIVLLDQPTIVPNQGGQRPVENIVSSAVGLRRGGMQPANTSKMDMFGTDAPIRHFLKLFGGPADPLQTASDTCIFETYPVLTIIALDWLQPDSRLSGRLPKYNPKNKNFKLADWKYLCDELSTAIHERGLSQMSNWINQVADKPKPRKEDQDCLDACVCLLVALHLIEQKDCLIVGNQKTGYIVVPHSDGLHRELDERCLKTALNPPDWVRKFKLNYPQL